MKNFILNNNVKILLILFFIFLFLTLNNNIFAAEYPSPLDIPDINYTYKGWVINYNETDNKYTMLLYATDNLDYFNLTSLTYGNNFSGDKKDIRVHTNFPNYGIYLHTWTFELVDGVWSNGLYKSLQKNEYRALEISSVSICESTRDIYYRGTEEIFFQVPVTELVIPALETADQIPTAMVETLKMIIPVGLVIFGILLLILLVKSVISRMT